MSKLYLPIGMIGTGKSTWARQFILTGTNTKIVAGDDIRFMLGGEYRHDEQLEPVVIDMLMVSTQILLGHGYDVILDECYCSLTTEMRSRVVQAFCKHNEIIAVVFPERDMEDHIEDKIIKGLRGKTVAYWKRVFLEMKAIYEPVCVDTEQFSGVLNVLETA